MRLPKIISVNVRRIITTGLLASGLAISAWAQTPYTWTGLAGDGLFNTPGNWQGNVVPTGLSTDNIVFGVYPLQSLRVTTSLNVGDITFSGIQDGFNLIYQFPDTPTLTLNGNVTTTAGSTYWGLFNLPVILAAGNHTYNTGGAASIYHFDAISGVGGITKSGPNSLYLTQTSTYNGGTILNSGTLAVGDSYALGYGPVTLNGGTLRTAYAYNDITLGNDFVFGANVNIDTSPFFDDDPTINLILGNSDSSTMAPASGVTTVNFNLVGDGSLRLTGNMANGAAATTYAFGGGSGNPAYVLTGFNDYTGGTLVKTGASIIFENATAAVPATGLITTEDNAYAGLGDNFLAVPTFLSRLDPANFKGVIGFDNDWAYSGAINLAGFAQSSVAIGTMSSATLTGLITPVTGTGIYKFKGNGWLTLADPVTTNPLTGTNQVNVTSLFEDKGPLIVILAQTGANNYSGTTTAQGAGLIFDGDSTLSPATTLNLDSGGYIGVTDSSGYDLTDLVTQFGSVTGAGVLGVDSSTAVNNGGVGPLYNYLGTVDFKTLPANVYLGTTGITNVIVPIETASNNTGDYYFTGYRNGSLTIGSQLTGAKTVHIGLPGVNQSINEFYSSVTLTNISNTFTGGIVLNSGQLNITNPSALGTNSLTVDAAANSDQIAALLVSPLLTIPNNIAINSGQLNLYGNGSTISGTISGSGSLMIDSAVVLSGANTFDGGTFVNYNGPSVYNNTALGTGFLDLDNGALVQFYTTAPQIGSLIRGDPYTEDGTFYASLILAATGTTALTINQSDDGLFSGAIVQSGSVGSLIKTGPASLQINGDLNSGYVPYSGGTTILQGKLIAGSAGALGTGTITINGGLLDTAAGVALANPISFGANGGTLGGSGTFSVPITVGTNVALDPGSSPGIMTFTSGLTLAPGGLLNFEVQSAAGPAGTGYDLVNISNGLLDVTATSGNPFTIKLVSLTPSNTSGNVSDFSSSIGYTWMLFQGNPSSGINGFSPNKFTLDTSLFTNPLNGGVFSFTQGANGPNPALYLNFSPIPEPSTYALLGIGLGAMGINRWRRRLS